MSSNIPQHLKYTNSHEWVHLENNIATIGITDFAQKELGDIIFFELPSLQKLVKAGESMGTIEAVKTVADLNSPISGEVIEVNGSLQNSPDLVNKDCYNSGWIAKIKISNPDEIKYLLSSIDYERIVH